MLSTCMHVSVTVAVSLLPSMASPFVGSQYTLTCTVTGADLLNAAISYRWFTDNTVVSGETQSTLSFSPLSLSDAGRYRCDVTVSSTLLSQSIIAMSNTQNLTLQSKYFSITMDYAKSAPIKSLGYNYSSCNTCNYYRIMYYCMYWVVL